MAEDLPSEYDAIILGTGLPESVVAAALARIGHKVLHLDRNDYYSGYWASFSFESLQEWIKQNSKEEMENCRKIEAQHGEVCFPCRGNAISNIEVRSYLRNVEPDNNEDADKQSGVNIANLVPNPSDGNAGKGSEVMTAHEPTHVPELNSDTRETYEEQNASCDSNNDAQSCHEAPTGTEEKTESNNISVVVPGSHENPECQDNEEHVDQSDVSEVTRSNIGPECDGGQKETVEESAEDAPEVQNVQSWAGKRKMKNAKKLDRHSTHKDFSEKSRKFNLDLSPKVLFSRGLLVESLISANISHYAEFKIVSRILTYMDGKIEEVPCSRSDVFGSELINVLEKRALMRFMTFCSTFEDCPEQYESFKDKPFIDFLKSRKLTTNLQHIILNAIAGVPATTSTLSGLKATWNFLRSLGRYGNTPFLWSLYGAGELPQAFCRMCAVFGGIYCLRKNVKSLVLDEDNKNCLAVISEDGQRLHTKWLIMESSYVPDVFEIVTQCMTSRAILITDRSLKQASREHISIFTIPTRSNGYPVRVIELAPSSMACPESLYVVHFTTETVVNASEDLNSYVEDLFTTPDTVGNDNGSEKPVVLWSVYFNMESGVPTNISKLPSNVRITSLPSTHLDFQDALTEAKDIFTSICPNEDFLPAVPNPEDIIWDDIGSNTKEEQSEQASEDVVPATDQRHSEGSTEESQEESYPSAMNAGEMSTSDESPKTGDGNKDTSNGFEA